LQGVKVKGVNMRIALLSCTSSKKNYKCETCELYSESPRFRLAYEYAKLIADRVFILSAKYGLLQEFDIIEPYNEILNEKTTQERRLWSDKVINELKVVSNLQEDEFIVIAGESYNEFILPELKQYWQPLKGKALGEWIPELKKLIDIESDSVTANVLHRLFNGMPRLDWSMIDSLP
jgi:hypothetical protein